MAGGRISRCQACQRLLLYGQTCLCGTKSGAARPQNVRIEHADGRVTPVELAYLGFDAEEGCHVWECATPITDRDVLHAETLPGQTSIIFAADPS